MTNYEFAEKNGYETLSARARLIDIMVKGSQELECLAGIFIKQLELEDERHTGIFDNEHRALMAAQNLERILRHTARNFRSQLKTLLNDFNFEIKRG